MIQIYAAGNTEYEKNGDAVLHPSVCDVEEILKGSWQLTLENPNDENINFIKAGAVIKTDTNIGAGQLFRIFDHEKSDSGVTANAYPIFFDCGKDTYIADSRPTNRTGQEALDILFSGTRYTGESDIRDSRTAYWQKKNCLEALNSDDENSFISRWGGEPIYDNYHVRVNYRAGGDYGARAAFGFNLRGIEEQVNFEKVVTRIIPESYNGHMLEGDKPWVDSPNMDKYPIVYTKVVQYSDVKMQEDCSEEGEGFQTLEELRKELVRRAEQSFADGIDKPEVSYDIDIVPLENTVEYEDMKELVTISLGDTVRCTNRGLDIETLARVTSLTYDCINGRITALHLGDTKSNYFDNMSSVMQAASQAINPDGTAKGEKIVGIMNGLVARLRASAYGAVRQADKNVMYEDLDPDSPTFGAMALGTTGFMIASERTPDGKDWDWKTFGTGKGFIADLFIAGMITSKNYNEETGEGFMFDLDSGKLVAADAVLTGAIKTKSDGFGHYMQMSSEGLSLYSGYGGKLEKVFSLSATAVLAEDGGEVKTYGPQIWFDKKASGLRLLFTDGSGGWTFGKDMSPTNTKFPGSKTGRAEFSDGSYLKFSNGVLVEGKTAGGGSTI